MSEIVLCRTSAIDIRTKTERKLQEQNTYEVKTAGRTNKTNARYTATGVRISRENRRHWLRKRNDRHARVGRCPNIDLFGHGDRRVSVRSIVTDVSDRHLVQKQRTRDPGGVRINRAPGRHRSRRIRRSVMEFAGFGINGEGAYRSIDGVSVGDRAIQREYRHEERAYICRVIYTRVLY